MQTRGRKKRKEMLKYKVWSKNKQTFLKDAFISQCGELYIIFYHRIVHLNVQDHKILRYTGLHDKKGSEIYEGDVVKIKDDLYRVGWNGCFSSFYMKNLDKDKQNNDLYFLNRDYKKAEIIGNIYENEEFLKNEQN